MKRVSATIVEETSEKMRNARIELLIQKEGEHRENVLNPAPSLAIFAPFQQKYLSAGKLAAPVDGSWTCLVAGCCVAAPSPVTSLSLIGRVDGGVITLLCMCLEKHLREDGCASLSCLLSSGVAGPTVPAGPGGYNTHPIPSSILLISQ